MTNPEWEFTLSRMRALADRMVEAGWLKAFGFTNDGMAFEWTEFGLTKIKQLSSMWDELTPAAFDPEYHRYFWQMILRAAVENGIRKPLD